MKEYSSCKSAIQSCIENKSFAVAHLYNDERPMDMHIHDCYEIYYSISGGKQFLIDNRFYDIQPGDIFLLTNMKAITCPRLIRLSMNGLSCRFILISLKAFPPRQRI